MKTIFFQSLLLSQFLLNSCLTVKKSKVLYSSIITFEDARDGNHYQAVILGDQTWMIENLRFDVPHIQTISSELEVIDTFNAELDSSFGRYYDYKTATMGDSSEKTQGICPEGWHIPSEDEWKSLITYLDNQKNKFTKHHSGNTSEAGLKMKSTKNWFENPHTNKTGNGNNRSKLNMLPAGHYLWDAFDNYGCTSTYWSSTSKGKNHAFAITLRRSEDFVWFDEDSKKTGKSCRCIKN